MTTRETIDGCTYAEAHLQDYHDGVLETQVVQVIDAHLATCDECARAYAFEPRIRGYVKECCGGLEREERCREEFRRKLEDCRQTAREQARRDLTP